MMTVPTIAIQRGTDMLRTSKSLSPVDNEISAAPYCRFQDTVVFRVAAQMLSMVADNFRLADDSLKAGIDG